MSGTSLTCSFPPIVLRGGKFVLAVEPFNVQIVEKQTRRITLQGDAAGVLAKTAFFARMTTLKWQHFKVYLL